MNEKMRAAQRKQFGDWAAEPPNRYDVEKFDANFDFLIKLDRFHDAFPLKTVHELMQLDRERKEDERR